jgi:hypothetical protein
LLSMTTRIWITRILTRGIAHLHMANSLSLHRTFTLIAVTKPFQLPQPTVTMTPYINPLNATHVCLSRFDTDATRIFCVTQRNITFFTTARHWDLSCAIDPQSVSFKKHFNIIIPSTFRPPKCSIPL